MMAHTRLLIRPWSHARATAYTYDRLAFIFVYISAILPEGKTAAVSASARRQLHPDADVAGSRSGDLKGAIEPTLHQLEGPHGLSKLFAVVHVLDSMIERGLHQAG